MVEAVSARTPVRWSRARRAAVVALGLLMTYLHSLYILAFYVREDEYWFPFWTGMTAEQRLLSLALALFANFGLMTMPFVRVPGCILRALMAPSLAFGLVISVAWLGGDLWVMGLPDVGPIPSTENIIIFLIDILLFIGPITVRIFYFVTICLNLWFLVSLARTFLTVRRSADNGISARQRTTRRGQENVGFRRSGHGGRSR